MSDFACEAELKVPGDMIYLRPVRAFVRELAKSKLNSRDNIYMEKIRKVAINMSLLLCSSVKGSILFFLLNSAIGFFFIFLQINLERFIIPTKNRKR